MIRAAAILFAGRAYDGISIDDLVTHLGIHRNSLYKTFGSKRGLYLTTLRWHLRHRVRPLLARLGAAADPAQALAVAGSPELGLLLLAAVDRAPVDAEVAEEVAGILRDFDAAVDGAPSSGPAGALTATILGLHLRARMSAAPTDHLHHRQ